MAQGELLLKPNRILDCMLNRLLPSLETILVIALHIEDPLGSSDFKVEFKSIFNKLGLNPDLLKVDDTSWRLAIFMLFPLLVILQ